MVETIARLVNKAKKVLFDVGFKRWKEEEGIKFLRSGMKECYDRKRMSHLHGTFVWHECKEYQRAIKWLDKQLGSRADKPAGLVLIPRVAEAAGAHACAPGDKGGVYAGFNLDRKTRGIIGEEKVIGVNDARIKKHTKRPGNYRNNTGGGRNNDSHSNISNKERDRNYTGKMAPEPSALRSGRGGGGHERIHETLKARRSGESRSRNNRRSGKKFAVIDRHK